MQTEMTLTGSYRQLITACRDAGLMAEEVEHHPADYNSSWALLFRDGFRVGTLVSTGTMGAATLHMSLHLNRLDVFRGVFDSLQLQGVRG